MFFLPFCAPVLQYIYIKSVCLHAAGLTNGSVKVNKGFASGWYSVVEDQLSKVAGLLTDWFSFRATQSDIPGLR